MHREQHSRKLLKGPFANVNVRSFIYLQHPLISEMEHRLRSGRASRLDCSAYTPRARAQFPKYVTPAWQCRLSIQPCCGAQPLEGKTLLSHP